MRPIVLIICCLPVFLIFFSCEMTTAPDLTIKENNPIARQNETEEGTLEKVQVYSPSLEGNLLGDPAERSVNIYLPKSYYSHPSKRFPVIYYLHGLPASEDALMNSDMFWVLNHSAQLNHPVDFPEEGFLSWINDLINEGGMKEAIVVIPNAATRYAISFYTNNEVQGNYEDYIAEDLVFYIDMNYNTIPHFNYRAITGHSAGGYGALRIAMRNPDVFRYTVGMSPGIFPQELVMAMADYVLLEQNLWGFEGPSPYDPADFFKFMTNAVYSCAAAWLPNPGNPPYYVDLPFAYSEEGQVIMNDELMAKWNSESLFNLILENEKGIKKLKSFSFDCGINDDLMMYPSNLALHEMLDEMKVKHHFETHEGTHFSNLYDRLGKALVDLSNGFPEDD